MPRIAAYRDAFYEAYIRQQSGQHGERLRAEAVTGKQPLAGARQHLNQQLARRRASQLEHVHLALLFARIGLSRGRTATGARRARGLGAHGCAKSTAG